MKLKLLAAFELVDPELELELELAELEPEVAKIGLGVRGLVGAGRGLIRFLWRIGLIT